MPAASSSSTSCQRFSLPRAGDVGVGELVDQRHLGAAGQHGVDVHLGERRRRGRSSSRRGHDLQALEQLGGVRAAVGLDEPDDDVGAALDPAVALVEHRVGLADPGRRAEVDPQPSARHAVHSPSLHGPGSATRGVERQVELEHVDPRLTEEPERPALGVLRRPAPRRRPGSGRAPAPPGATCSAAYAGLMSGSSPEPLAVQRVGGDRGRGDAVEPRPRRRGAADRRRSGPCSPGRGWRRRWPAGRTRPGRRRTALEVRRVGCVTTLPSASFFGFPSHDGSGERLPDQGRPDEPARPATAATRSPGSGRRPGRRRSSPAGRRDPRSRSARAASAARRSTAAVPGDVRVVTVGLLLSADAGDAGTTSRSMSLMPTNGAMRPPRP